MNQGPLHFVPQDFQKPFFHSTAMFPARISPWGDGKTLCMIMKGIALSQMYPGNEGLITRTRYNALQRSTIRDFQTWTGLKVPDQKQRVEIPGTGSVIHFTHADNLEEFRYTIQGMNLGWAGIEQADELDNAEVFEMLIGRVRRILTPNAEIQAKMVELGIIKKPVANFNVFSEEEAERIEKAIIEQLGLPVRQLMIIANTLGHNWFYKRWKEPLVKNRKPLDGYVLYEGKPFENKRFVPATTRKNWEQLKITSPKKHNRYVMNSWEDYDIEGSYYAGLMSDALKDGRMEQEGLYDTTVPVYTFWDLGVSDDTAIWFVQFIDSSINLIDFYSNDGEGMEHYSQILDSKPYKYADHYLPHDAAHRLQGAVITTRLDILRRLRTREDVYIVEKHSVQERIQAVRSLLNKCKFDNLCETGTEALIHYHRDLNKIKSTDELTVFLDKPAHDQYSHPADAFGYLAMAYRYHSIGGQILGYTGAKPEWYEDDGVDVGVTDLLSVG